MIDDQTTESIVDNGEYKKVSPNVNIKPADASTSSIYSPFTFRKRIFVDKDSPKIITLHIDITKEIKRQFYSRINSIFRKLSNY